MQSESLKPGLEAQASDTVTDGNTAAALGSGGISVYATPAMIALMEKAACAAVATHLPPGCSTVGTEVNVRHLCATPCGMNVTAKAKLLGIDGRALHFAIEAHDEAGKIGEGLHSRFIIEEEKFMVKTESRKKSD